MIELDNLDVKILAHLQSNSRESFQEIAKLGEFEKKYTKLLAKAI